jgi:hypothetical protein
MAFTQTINGRTYDFSSIQVQLGSVGVPVNIIKISYSDGLEPGEQRGTSPVVQGTSVGEHSAELSFTLSLEDAVVATDTLGPSFGTVEFQIICTYADEGRPTVTDTINRVRIKKISQDAERGDPLVREFECHVAAPILWNGKPIWAGTTR